jgi:hypothetical protein
MLDKCSLHKAGSNERLQHWVFCMRVGAVVVRVNVADLHV